MDEILLSYNYFESISYAVIYILSLTAIFFAFPFLIFQSIYDGIRFGWTSRVDNRLFANEIILSKILFGVFGFLSSLYLFFIKNTFFIF